MELHKIILDIADILKKFNSEKPVYKDFKSGIGPIGEPQLVKEISSRLNKIDYHSQTRRTPDLDINSEWAVEFKIVCPFGDNGNVAENCSVSMLHPYPGNTSLGGGGIKLYSLDGFSRKAMIAIGYEHSQPKINLVPSEHQVVKCVGWELLTK